jgi:hypothetical protein
VIKINTTRLILAIDGILSRRDAEKVRGYLGDIFWDNPIVHHHLPNGSFVYKYPFVQYKVIKRNCFIIGFFDGEEVVKKVFKEIENIFISDSWKMIHLKALERQEENFGPTIEPIEYVFPTPWLALNDINYEKYKCIKNGNEKKRFLANILNANIISVAKSLDYTITSKIHTEILRIKPAVVKLKDTKLLGFYAKFKTNFEIPTLWGLGKSVSRGFGTVIKKSQINNIFQEVLNLFP